MQARAIPIGEPFGEISPWDNAPPLALEEQEFGILAFALWQRGNSQATACDDEWLEAEKALGCHASCL